ncbi:hypothetical protein ACO7RW_00970 [Bacillus amyloliquefaciens]|uniref:hypothetical protein n=1 Tax=Bacillus amyloliquefaciens group TaxID=1938374 RepID=UPI0006245C78|nr:hypothetical protein [Bacillus velezensis]AKF30922.1 hypothetical protein AAV29_10310 [Bacillus velezensis]MDV5127072.1 hypothetical protein [Bacillus velezensis]
MSWGISPDATNKEQLKAEMADYLNGLNSTGAISYAVYSEAIDFSMKILDQMYDLGKFEK